MKIKKFNESGDSERISFLKDVFIELKDEYTEYEFVFGESFSSGWVTIKPHVKNTRGFKDDVEYSNESFNRHVRFVSRRLELIKGVGACINTMLESNEISNVKYTDTPFYDNSIVTIGFQYADAYNEITPDGIFELTNTTLTVHQPTLLKYFDKMNMVVGGVELYESVEGDSWVIGVMEAEGIDWEDGVSEKLIFEFVEVYNTPIVQIERYEGGLNMVIDERYHNYKMILKEYEN